MGNVGKGMQMFRKEPLHFWEESWKGVCVYNPFHKSTPPSGANKSNDSTNLLAVSPDMHQDATAGCTCLSRRLWNLGRTSSVTEQLDRCTSGCTVKHKYQAWQNTSSSLRKCLSTCVCSLVSSLPCLHFHWKAFEFLKLSQRTLDQRECDSFIESLLRELDFRSAIKIVTLVEY